MNTYETGRVVVTHGLGVTEGFKYGVGLYDLVLKGPLKHKNTLRKFTFE